MVAFFKFVSAIFTRVLFFVHGLVTVYLVVISQGNNSKYWWLMVGLVLMVFESFYTIIVRKCKEYKYFWPGSLLYMLTVLPSIWVVEIDMLEQKSKDPQTCLTNSTGKITSLGGGVVSIKVDKDTLAQKFSELGLILSIIVGRWLLPRGELTRDQLSALLLVYVSNAADIIELFEVFDDQPNLWCIDGLAYAVLATYSWCFMQFTLVFTATVRTVPDATTTFDNKIEKAVESKEETEVNKKKKTKDKKLPKYIRKLVDQRKRDKIDKLKNLYTAAEATRHKPLDRGNQRKRVLSIQETVMEVVEIQKEAQEEVKAITEHIKETRRLKLHGDLYSILTMMFMQDGPFLVVRLLMIIRFNVNHDMHLFFTGKNATALLLLIYRLIVVLTEAKEDEKEEHCRDNYYSSMYESGAESETNSTNTREGSPTREGSLTRESSPA